MYFRKNKNIKKNDILDGRTISKMVNLPAIGSHPFLFFFGNVMTEMFNVEDVSNQYLLQKNVVFNDRY